MEVKPVWLSVTVHTCYLQVNTCCSDLENKNTRSYEETSERKVLFLLFVFSSSTLQPYLIKDSHVCKPKINRVKELDWLDKVKR